MSKLPSPPRPPQWADLAALTAVLATGILLTVLGHLTAGGVTTVCAALTGVYGTWRRVR